MMGVDIRSSVDREAEKERKLTIRLLAGLLLVPSVFRQGAVGCLTCEAFTDQELAYLQRSEELD
jgi:hypothetical protein